MSVAFRALNHDELQGLLVDPVFTDPLIRGVRHTEEKYRSCIVDETAFATYRTATSLTASRLLIAHEVTGVKERSNSINVSTILHDPRGAYREDVPLHVHTHPYVQNADKDVTASAGDVFGFMDIGRALPGHISAVATGSRRAGRIILRLYRGTPQDAWQDKRTETELALHGHLPVEQLQAYTKTLGFNVVDVDYDYNTGKPRRISQLGALYE